MENISDLFLSLAVTFTAKKPCIGIYREVLIVTLVTVRVCCDVTLCRWEEFLDVSKDHGAFYLKDQVVHEEGILSEAS